MPEFADAALLANEAELEAAYAQLQKARGAAAKPSATGRAPHGRIKQYGHAQKFVTAEAETEGELLVKAAAAERVLHTGMDATATGALDFRRPAHAAGVRREAVREHLQKSAADAGVPVPVYTDEQLDAAIRPALVRVNGRRRGAWLR